MAECMAETLSTVDYPDHFDARSVRAAHIYNIAFTHVREIFAVSGLLTHIQVLSKRIQLCIDSFNFVCYFRQLYNLMAFFSRVSWNNSIEKVAPLSRMYG